MMASLLRLLRHLGWPLLLMLAAVFGARLAQHDEAEHDRNATATAIRSARPRLLRLLLTWLLLLVLLAIEFGISFLPMERSVRPIILVPAVLMVATVGSMFMQVKRGPTVVRLFATAGLLWLTILLGLSSVDPLTRTDYQVHADSSK